MDFEILGCPDHIKPEAREVDLYPLGSMLGVPHSLQAPSAMAPVS